MLDELYQLQDQFNKLEESSQQQVQELIDFFDEHERVKEKIAFYCRFPESFLPLGVRTKPLLARAFELKKQKGIA